MTDAMMDLHGLVGKAPDADVLREMAAGQPAREVLVPGACAWPKPPAPGAARTVL